MFEIKPLSSHIKSILPIAKNLVWSYIKVTALMSIRYELIFAIQDIEVQFCANVRAQTISFLLYGNLVFHFVWYIL